jgi:hypothetical protein
MKVNKALKRLTKLEAILADVTARYSSAGSSVKEALHDAKVAVSRAKQAVRADDAAKPPIVTSPGVKQPSVKPQAKPLPEVAKKPVRRISEEGLKRIVAATKKRWALKHAEAAKAAGAAKKSTAKPVAAKKASLKAPSKAAVKKAAPATGQKPAVAPATPSVVK